MVLYIAQVFLMGAGFCLGALLLMFGLMWVMNQVQEGRLVGKLILGIIALGFIMFVGSVLVELHGLW